MGRSSVRLRRAVTTASFAVLTIPLQWITVSAVPEKPWAAIVLASLSIVVTLAVAGSVAVMVAECLHATWRLRAMSLASVACGGMAAFVSVSLFRMVAIPALGAMM